VAEAVAAFVAWLGVTVVVLADGRRGLAVGTLLAAVGLAGVSFQMAGYAALALVVGGMAAAARRFVAGPAGWAIMPAGSTPRLVMCVAGGLLVLWVGVVVLTGQGGALRFAAISVLALAGARALSTEESSAVQTSVALLALAVGAVATSAPGDPGIWPYAGAALVAAAVTWAPARTPRAA
jgi:hypothetical protein